MRTVIKKALLLGCLFLPLALSAAVSPNNARKAGRIYLDSRKGNGGMAEWRMCRQDQAGQGEAISRPGFDDAAWLSARVPGTVLTNESVDFSFFHLQIDIVKCFNARE